MKSEINHSNEMVVSWKHFLLFYKGVCDRLECKRANLKELQFAPNVEAAFKWIVEAYEAFVVNLSHGLTTSQKSMTI